MTGTEKKKCIKEEKTISQPRPGGIKGTRRKRHYVRLDYFFGPLLACEQCRTGASYRPVCGHPGVEGGEDPFCQCRGRITVVRSGPGAPLDGKHVRRLPLDWMELLQGARQWVVCRLIWGPGRKGGRMRLGGVVPGANDMLWMESYTCLTCGFANQQKFNSTS